MIRKLILPLLFVLFSVGAAVGEEDTSWEYCLTMGVDFDLQVPGYYHELQASAQVPVDRLPPTLATFVSNIPPVIEDSGALRVGVDRIARPLKHPDGTYTIIAVQIWTEESVTACKFIAYPKGGEDRT